MRKPSARGFARWLGETRAGRRSLIGVACALAVAGVALLSYPWLTDIYTNELVQRRLRADFRRPEMKVRYEKRQIAIGESLTRIVIPKLGIDSIVVEGISPAALRAGVGHYPSTPLPGEAGNMGIGGHRTTYGKPFASLDRLAPGDEIHLETPLGYYVYKVSEAPFVTEPTNRAVMAATRNPTLTLTTCNPPGEAYERLIVHAAYDPEAGG